MELEIYQQKKQWRWRITAKNNKIVAASSEGFNRRAGAVNNLRLTAATLASTTIEGDKESIVDAWRTAHDQLQSQHDAYRDNYEELLRIYEDLQKYCDRLRSAHQALKARKCSFFRRRR